MAKQLNYTHPNGTNYPQSYWRITYLIVDVPKRYAKFTFSGYKDQQARLEEKEPIGTRILFILNSDFDTYFAEVTNKTMNPQEVGYAYCTIFKDISVPVVVQNEGQETTIIEIQSFFKNSIDCQ